MARKSDGNLQTAVELTLTTETKEQGLELTQ